MSMGFHTYSSQKGIEAMPFSLEAVYQIWDDKHGSRIEVSPDKDGLDMVEVRFVDDAGQVGASIVMQPEQAALVARAIGDTIKALHKPSGPTYRGTNHPADP